VHYEATRAGLDPQLVLGLIQVESGFKKYAVSSAGARGFMQVMPFWVKLIGRSDDNLFHLRTNLRYGCTILRHYLDIERATSTARSAATTAASASPNTRTWCAPPGKAVDTPRASWLSRRALTPAALQRPAHPRHHALHAAHQLPMPPLENCFIIFCVCSNCLSRRLTSCT
jgi:soluble lytic murein transglycosylase-like protein